MTETDDGIRTTDRRKRSQQAELTGRNACSCRSERRRHEPAWHMIISHFDRPLRGPACPARDRGGRSRREEWPPWQAPRACATRASRASARRSWRATGSVSRTASRSTGRHDLLGLGPARQPRARAAARRRRLLRVEHPHQPHERLRGHLRLLRLRGQEGRAARATRWRSTRSSTNVAGRCRRPVREVHIVGGLHPDLPWSYFTDMMRGIKQRPARHPHQGLHGGRDLLLPPALPDERRAGAGAS